MKRIGHYIDGQVVDGGDKTGPVYNPARGEQSGEVAMASASELDNAVAIAEKAQREWRTVPLAKRSAMMFKLREIIASRTEQDGDLLQLADFCLEDGARVLLHEYAPWAGYHVDGSSDMEALIDQSSATGVAHINPAGNLSTSKKLYKQQLPAGQAFSKQPALFVWRSLCVQHQQSPFGVGNISMLPLGLATSA